jgi:hypothetical protein
MLLADGAQVKSAPAQGKFVIRWSPLLSMTAHARRS